MDFSGLEKLSLVDFDDNLTATLFMAGCPFRCPFCHNGDLVLRPSSCVKIPWEEILEFLKGRTNFLDAVCISGGEPTLMDDLEEKIRQIKELGYKVKLDSNGCHPAILKDLIGKGLLDYVAMDIKNSQARYEETAGTRVDMDAIKESVAFLMSCGIDYEFRTTLVEEFHSLNDIKEIASWIKGAKKYFLQRFIANEHCIEKGLHEVPLANAKEMKAYLEGFIGEVSLRGYDD